LLAVNAVAAVEALNLKSTLPKIYNLLRTCSASVSHKFAHLAAAQFMEDLEQNHGRPCLKASSQDLATHVGTVVQTKEESRNYTTPSLGKVATSVWDS
jgi:hypothetical protein